jgi:hypothetical protein
MKLPRLFANPIVIAAIAEFVVIAAIVFLVLTRN